MIVVWIFLLSAVLLCTLPNRKTSSITHTHTRRTECRSYLQKSEWPAAILAACATVESFEYFEKVFCASLNKAQASFGIWHSLSAPNAFICVWQFFAFFKSQFSIFREVKRLEISSPIYICNRQNLSGVGETARWYYVSNDIEILCNCSISLALPGHFPHLIVVYQSASHILQSFIGLLRCAVHFIRLAFTPRAI